MIERTLEAQVMDRSIGRRGREIDGVRIRIHWRQNHAPVGGYKQITRQVVGVNASHDHHQTLSRIDTQTGSEVVIGLLDGSAREVDGEVIPAQVRSEAGSLRKPARDAQLRLTLIGASNQPFGSIDDFGQLLCEFEIGIASCQVESKQLIAAAKAEHPGVTVSLGGGAQDFVIAIAESVADGERWKGGVEVAPIDVEVLIGASRLIGQRSRKAELAFVVPVLAEADGSGVAASAEKLRARIHTAGVEDRLHAGVGP